MTTIKKGGFVRGLKKFTQMFDEKEEEIQIGYPTDVKHVAHIGSDAPSATTPSWMSEFKSSSETLSNNPMTTLEDDRSLPESHPEGSNRRSSRSRRSSAHGSATLDSPDQRKSNAPRPSRRKPSVGSNSPENSPTARDEKKHSRRRRSSNNSIDGDSSSGHNKSRGLESSADDQPSIPKHSNGKRSKGRSRSKEKAPHLDSS